VSDLAPVDGFHVRGRAATDELAELAGLQPDWRVLDVGSGPGGSARYLAEKWGCRVLGVDLTPAYVDLATILSDLVGLAESTDFRVASATALPCGNAEFDLVWLEHVQMNIADKAGLVSELGRVLRPGGRLALHEVFLGGGGTPHLPVPWAETPDTSFLVAYEDLRDLLLAADMRLVVERDASETALQWFRKQRSRPRAAPSPLGLHLLMGPRAKDKVANLARNLEEERVRIVQLVVEKQ
jgi:MPBQ/MSBQ methyltransferase